MFFRDLFQVLINLSHKFDFTKIKIKIRMCNDVYKVKILYMVLGFIKFIEFIQEAPKSKG
jgi:hypothetical protein